jgi:hypothetical protein
MKLTEINLRKYIKKTVNIAVEPKIGKGLRRMLSQKLSRSECLLPVVISNHAYRFSDRNQLR